ncbi:hypothetical protein IB241_04260 [Pseudomonas sp. PDM05]|jgi:hypothetical protein|uniref:hypothetical protein n=1 Tax=Pseudomonas sp. PDM05 TaxID=2769301 RepID=UPI00177DD61D|nr:hypothetical protein [Pseudomonas sp. PDM05]MBD9456884.1 hypothetical protein [Pseudomonas sp. PDM05]
MPIDSNSYAYSNSGNNHNYANKYQSIAPETSTSHSSWHNPEPRERSSSTYSSASSSQPLLNQTPSSSLSATQKTNVQALTHQHSVLSTLPEQFPTSAIPKESYNKALNLTEKRITQEQNPPSSRNPVTQYKHRQEVKKTDKELGNEMKNLYKQARDVQTNGTNQTDKNRASNHSDSLLALGNGQPWLKDVRKENRKAEGV